MQASKKMKSYQKEGRRIVTTLTIYKRGGRFLPWKKKKKNFRERGNRENSQNPHLENMKKDRFAH